VGLLIPGQERTTRNKLVRLLMQGFAQVPDLRVWYGPDTYMGRNLAQLFTSMAQMSDAEVAAVHPQHTQVSAAPLRCTTPRQLSPRVTAFVTGS